MALGSIERRALLVGLEIGMNELDQAIDVLRCNLTILVHGLCSLSRSYTVSFC